MKITKTRALKAFGPERGRLLAELLSRRALPDKQKVLCLAACLQAKSENADLTSLLEMTLSSSKDLASVYEVLLQGYLFCGYPRAIESFFCLESAAKEAGLSLDGIQASALEASETLIERGRSTAAAVHRDKFGRMHNKISAISPDLGYLMIAEGYGHILCRPGLDLRSRELAIVSSLTTLGAMRQLNSHVRGALNVGCTPPEAYEAILLCLPWLGIERIREAGAVWAQIIGGDVKALASAYKWL